MRYQVRIKDTMSDKPASELFEDLEDAKAALEEVRKEIRETWATPDEDAAYIASYWWVDCGYSNIMYIPRSRKEAE